MDARPFAIANVIRPKQSILFAGSRVGQVRILASRVVGAANFAPIAQRSNTTLRNTAVVDETTLNHRVHARAIAVAQIGGAAVLVSFACSIRCPRGPLRWALGRITPLAVIGTIDRPIRHGVSGADLAFPVRLVFANPVAIASVVGPKMAIVDTTNSSVNVGPCLCADTTITELAAVARKVQLSVFHKALVEPAMVRRNPNRNGRCRRRLTRLAAQTLFGNEVIVSWPVGHSGARIGARWRAKRCAENTRSLPHGHRHSSDALSTHRGRPRSVEFGSGAWVINGWWTLDLAYRHAADALETVFDGTRSTASITVEQVPIVAALP